MVSNTLTSMKTAVLNGCDECGEPQSSARYNSEAQQVCVTCLETAAYPLSPVYLELYYSFFESRA